MRCSNAPGPSLDHLSLTEAQGTLPDVGIMQACKILGEVQTTSEVCVWKPRQLKPRGLAACATDNMLAPCCWSGPLSCGLRILRTALLAVVHTQQPPTQTYCTYLNMTVCLTGRGYTLQTPGRQSSYNGPLAYLTGSLRLSRSLMGLP